MDKIDQFIKDIILAGGIYDENMIAEIQEDLRIVLLDKLLVYLTVKLGDQQQVQFTNLLDNLEFERAINYLQSNVKNFDQEVDNFLIKFGEDFVNYINMKN